MNPGDPGGRLRDVGLTSLAPATWGSTYLVTTEFLPPGRPYLTSLVRALPAGLVPTATGRVVPRGIWAWRAMLLGALNIGLFLLLLFVAAYRLPGGVAALLMSFPPMLVLILAAALLGDRIETRHVTACVLGAGGVALLVLRPTATLLSVPQLVGALVIIAAVALAQPRPPSPPAPPAGSPAVPERAASR